MLLLIFMSQSLHHDGQKSETEAPSFCWF